MLGLKKRNLIGLDIDACAVRMVQLRKHGTGYALARAGVGDIAPWGDNPELRRFHTIQAVRKCLTASGIHDKSAVCALRGSDIVVRGFEFPVLPREEIEGAVGLEASQICPFGTDESTLDYQVTSNDSRKTRGFWVAANNTLIRDTRQLMDEAGLHCALIDVDGLALLNLLDSRWHDADGNTEEPAHTDPSSTTGKTEREKPVLLDVGSSCTTVAAADQSGRPFVRDIGFGGDEIVNRIAAETDMPIESIKTRLLEDPPSEESEEEDRIQTCLERACAPLLEDIGTTLRYYAAQNGSTHTKEMLVCGGFATMRGLIELLRMKLYVEATLWNPLVEMPCEAGEECESLLRRYGPCLAVATGLAMRSM